MFSVRSQNNVLVKTASLAKSSLRIEGPLFVVADWRTPVDVVFSRSKLVLH